MILNHIFACKKTGSTRNDKSKNQPSIQPTNQSKIRESHCGVVAKVLDYDKLVREFALQLRYYVHFRTNTLRKGMNSLFLTTMG